MTSGRTSQTNPVLARLVRRCRERLDPRDVPGLVRGHLARESSKVSQEEIAGLIGVTTRWYGTLERGAAAGYSPELLAQVAYALRMSEAERRLLYYSLGYNPPMIQQPDTDVREALARMVHEAPWPAYISDDAWDFLLFNATFAKWFPWAGYVPNVMEYIFCYPQARSELVDWETAWARPMLAQMRFAHVRNPTSQRLTSLVTKVLDTNAFARANWATLDAYEHPDGDHRRIYVAGRADPVEVELVACAPLRHPEWRVLHLVPR